MNFNYFRNPQNFPVNSLPNILHDAVLEVHNKIKAPIPLIVNSILGVTSLVCQNSVDVKRPGGLVSPVSLYIATIADSGERKTTVDSIIMKVVKDFDKAQYDVYQHDISEFVKASLIFDTKLAAFQKQIVASSKKGVESKDADAYLRAHLDSKPIKPRKARLLYQDVSVTAIKSGLLDNWTTMGIVSDEGGVVFDGAAVERLPLLNALWGGDDVIVDRHNSEVIIPGARLTFALMAQDPVFQRFVHRRNDEARGVGFLARFLISAPYSTQGSRYIEHHEQQWTYLPTFQHRLTEILSDNLKMFKGGSVERKVLDFDADAAHYWVTAINKIESAIQFGQILYEIRDYASKAGENMARIAALFHFVNGGVGPIGLDAISRAEEVMIWYINEFLRIFTPKPEVPQYITDAIILEKWLLDHCWNLGRIPIRRNDIRKSAPNSLRNKESFSNALNYLQSTGRVIFVTDGKASYVAPCFQYYNCLGIYFPTRPAFLPPQSHCTGVVSNGIENAILLGNM